MMKTALALAGLSLLTATPVLARGDAKPAPLPSPNAAGMEKGAAAKPMRYCVINKQDTGTIIVRKVCRTRDDWLGRGFDPLDPNGE